jgi:glutathione synthase/RimK-type ligase-like ATP-grasp enzyme
MMANSVRRVALATANGYLDEDVDLPFQLRVLRSHGVDAIAVPWDSETCDWSAFDAVVIRSTWDYSRRVDDYLAWIDHVASVAALHNPAPVVHWNSDKRYLEALQKNGITTIPTRYVSPDETVTLPSAGEFVVKPTISAGARDAARYNQSLEEEAQRHIYGLHQMGATVMIQPYLHRIAEGERALVFLNGRFSHAMRKGPVLAELGVVDNARVAHPELHSYAPTRTELDLAYEALATPPGRSSLLFARVDLAVADDGSPIVMELELIEPNLFMAHDSGALAAFAAAVRRHLDSTSRYRRA